MRYADRRIFVSIVAFRDRDLADTLRRAISAAERPARLRFGICHLVDDETMGVLDDFGEDPRVLVDRVPFGEGGGTGWARARAAELFDSERYVLQIDSPARFADRWDQRIIDQLDSTGGARPIVTGRPQNGGATEPARPKQLTAGQLFTHGRFVRDVPADPDLSGVDETIGLSVRAYTHGYDFFSPTELLVDVGEHSAPPPNPASGERQQRLVRGDDRGMGHHGLGPVRTAAAFRGFQGA